MSTVAVPPIELDGAYLRSIILSELTMVDTVLMPRPIAIERAAYPSNYFESQDFQTELWWNASYAPQVAAIKFVNRLIEGGKLDKADFRRVNLVPVEIDVNRGLFLYFREDLETFDRGYNEACAAFSRLGLPSTHDSGASAKDTPRGLQGMSAVQFQRQLGLTRYETAFGILHKLRAGMVRPDQDRIGGRTGEHVEVDETYVGGRTRGEGRGIHHKTLVTAAVEVRHREPGTAQDKRKDGRYAGRVRLSIADDRSAGSLVGFVESAVMPGALVITDDWSGYASLRKRGYDHHAIAECGDPEVAEEFLPISHLVFSNLKTWLNGIHHGVSAKHLQAYLNEFTSRFNRRFYPFNAFRSLLGIAGGAESPTFAELYSGEWAHPTCSGCLR